MKQYIARWAYFLVVILFSVLSARSPFRTPDPLLPKIVVKWAHGGPKSELDGPQLEEYPYFKIFDEPYLRSHTIPEGTIPFRIESDKSVEGTQLIAYIKQIIEEIKLKKKEFTHFVMIQDKDFNKRKGVGLIILRFKEYPFVLKLFIETPQSFVKPFSKGFEPIFFFFLGGGTGRHLNGFTRIKNLELVKKEVQNNKRWSSYIDFPRKWFWMPEENNWMEVRGYNLGRKKNQRINIPGTYCILTDEIKSQRHFSIYNRQDRDIALTFCNDLGQLIDAHINNFIIERTTNKLVVIDTEHFPSVVGFTKQQHFSSYTDWYTTLMRNCVRNMYCRTKRQRREDQFDKKSDLFLLN